MVGGFRCPHVVGDRRSRGPKVSASALKPGTWALLSQPLSCSATVACPRQSPSRAPRHAVPTVLVCMGWGMRVLIPARTDPSWTEPLSLCSQAELGMQVTQGGPSPAPLTQSLGHRSFMTLGRRASGSPGPPCTHVQRWALPCTRKLPLLGTVWSFPPRRQGPGSWRR